MAQYARPNADGAAKNWTPSTGTAHWSLIDESVTDDTDYISVTTGALASPDETMSLSSVTDPVASSGHIIRLRGKNSSGASAVTIRLYQGDPNGSGTQIAASTIAFSTSFADYSYTLSGAEADAITDYTTLWFSIDKAISKGVTQTISQAYFEVPDVGGGGSTRRRYCVATL